MCVSRTRLREVFIHRLLFSLFLLNMGQYSKPFQPFHNAWIGPHSSKQAPHEYPTPKPTSITLLPHTSCGAICDRTRGMVLLTVLPTSLKRSGTFSFGRWSLVRKCSFIKAFA